jgi:hypothetical protein
MLLEEFNYELPEKLIAQLPAQKREMSKMLILDRGEKSFIHKHFMDITDFLTENDLLVLNNTKVIPARLYATKETGALYLGLTKISDGKAEDVEILVDELSIFKTSDGKLSLKDYGQKYYKYIAATETEPAKYELVDGWIDGLELRTTLTNGIGWYQPNPTTVDGLSSRLTTVEAKAESNATAISTLDNNFDSRVNGLIANEVATLLSIKVVS